MIRTELNDKEKHMLQGLSYGLRYGMTRLINEPVLTPSLKRTNFE